MIEKEITIKLSNGLEARPVAMFVQIASKYDSQIRVESGNKKFNGKSLMGMMTLGLDAGDQVKVTAEGADEKEAIAEIEKFLSAE